MPKFIAIKIHYDHRKELASHLKYSTLPTSKQYKEYLQLFRKVGRGGNGFHECLNFQSSETEPVSIYIPPTCLPAKSNMNEEFVIFSFTYKSDKELSSSIVGVHAGARMLSNEPGGVPRNDGMYIEGVDSLHYHAEAPPNLVTLIYPAVQYDPGLGIHTKAYDRWGFGLRYIDEHHAARIVVDATNQASAALKDASISGRQILEREVEVLNRIADRYGFRPNAPPRDRAGGSANPQLPNPEAGYQGERAVYECELRYVLSIGRKEDEVEWVSQSNPSSEFDIKSVRLVNGQIQTHFIEVKSSTAEDLNIYISSRQLEFFAEHRDGSSFVFVRLNRDLEILGKTWLTLDELHDQYDLKPIKYKLAHRITNAA